MTCLTVLRVCGIILLLSLPFFVSGCYLLQECNDNTLDCIVTTLLCIIVATTSFIAAIAFSVNGILV